jgi:hypothetical protein
MEEILLRIQKLEDEIKKEREINRLLQFQISSINEEYVDKLNIFTEKVNNIEQLLINLNKKMENIVENIPIEESDIEDSKIKYNFESNFETETKKGTTKISTNDIFKKDLTFSKILDCIIDNKKPDRMTYRNILIHVLKKMNKEDILKHSSFSFIKEKVYSIDNGHNWCEDIQLSIQNKDAKNTLKEIIHLCELNKYVLFIQIKLSTREIITYRSTK